MAAAIAPPDQANLLSPILPALPVAAASTQPALQVLPLLSPILRQRVQLLSGSSTEPWLRLLCYDTSKAARLAEIARGPALEPHPVSGEVEVDWGYDAETRYRRVDDETLQALVVLSELGLAFRLVYCANDKPAQPDTGSSASDIKPPENGWRIGEVTVAEGQPSLFAAFGGSATIGEAEDQFRRGKSSKGKGEPKTSNGAEADDDDDDYWARYDATPARTPAQNQSPAPGHGNSSVRNAAAATGGGEGSRYQDTSAEDDYYAQYDSVQPAMDNHDPDEEQAAQDAHIIPPLGLGQPPERQEQPQPVHPLNNGTAAFAPFSEAPAGNGVPHSEAQLLHPRPDSSASSNGSQAVAKLEETAGRREQSEFGIKQHISRSVRSLFMLSRAAGIDRDEFDSLVRSELDVLGMMDDQE